MKIRYINILLLAFFMLTQPLSAETFANHKQPASCEERLNRMEPAVPKVMYDYEFLPDRKTEDFKEEIFPINTVLKDGSSIPFKVVYKDLSFKRPVYHPAWHSSYFRWSNVPLNMAHQQHIIYAYQGGLSWWYDVSHTLALPEKAGGPSEIHEYAFTIKYPYVVRLIVFNFDVSSIKYYKNQIVISGMPLRKGLTVVDFDTKNLPHSEKLLQLATPDGYEVDFLILQLSN